MLRGLLKLAITSITGCLFTQAVVRNIDVVPGIFIAGIGRLFIWQPYRALNVTSSCGFMTCRGLDGMRIQLGRALNHSERC